MGSKSRSFSALEISWFLLLLLGSSLWPADYAGNMFQYTDPGTLFLDQRTSGVMAIANPSAKNSSNMFQYADQGTLFLDQKTSGVIAIANPAAKNFNSIGNCSWGCTEAPVHHPLIEAQNLSFDTGTEELCSGARESNGTCTTLILNYKRSYLTLPPADPTCVKTLDSTLSMNSSSFTLIYFGSISGTFRAFPGWDNSNVSTLYPSRSAWYISYSQQLETVTDTYPDFGNDDLLIGVSSIDEIQCMIDELQFLKRYLKQKNQERFWQNVTKIQLSNHQNESKNDHLSPFTTHLDGSFFKRIDVRNFQVHELPSCSLYTMTSYALKTSFNNSFKLLRIKLIIANFGHVVVFLIVLRMIWKNIANFLFLNSNKDSNEKMLYQNLNQGKKLIPQSSQGSFGTVCKVKFLGIECAMKIFNSNARKDFIVEAATLSKLNHPHILKFFCCFKQPFILMELMDIDLYTFISNERIRNNNNYNLHPKVALEIMRQIAKGMSYLHKQGIAHRDLKSLNILLKLQGKIQDPNFQVIAKIADFGSVLSFNPKNPKAFVLFPKKNIGTPRWRAPELSHESPLNPIDRGFSYESSKYPKIMPKPLDIYGFAIVCHELLTGQVPFEDDGVLQVSVLASKVRAGHRPPIFPSERHPEGLVSLIKDCWQTNPTLRPEFDEICIRLSELITSS